MKVLIWFLLLFLMLLIYTFVGSVILAELSEGKHYTLLYVLSVLVSLFSVLACSWERYLL